MPQPLTLMTSDRTWTVETIVSQVARGRITAAPDLVYGEPWSERDMTHFMDSLLCGIPLGEAVITGPARGPFTLVDGARRIAALCLFHGVTPPWPHGGTLGFRLCNMEAAPWAEGMTAADLAASDTLGPLLGNASLRVVHVVPEHGFDAAFLRGRIHGGAGAMELERGRRAP